MSRLIIYIILLKKFWKAIQTVFKNKKNNNNKKTENQIKASAKVEYNQ